MKKNAILIGSIMFVAAGCAHQGGYGRAGHQSGSDTAVQASSMTYSTENPVRNPDGLPQTPASTAAQYDPGSYSTSSSTEIRARGVDSYSGSQNSSLSELGSGTSSDTQFSIDSSVGSDRDDFGQGSSGVWQTDKASGSIRGSANWNASDDLIRDGISSGDEMNNDASIGGAASSESGSGSSSDAPANGDLNASPQLEENISGEYSIPQNSDSDARVPDRSLGHDLEDTTDELRPE